jgi:hypothetical protein
MEKSPYISYGLLPPFWTPGWIFGLAAEACDSHVHGVFFNHFINYSVLCKFQDGDLSLVEYKPLRREKMTKAGEKQEISNTKEVVFEQDALYHAYASKSPEWHRDMTQRLLRKVDWRLLPFLILMYLLNFLDRK